MKLVTFTAAGHPAPRAGVAGTEMVHPFPAQLTMRDVIAGGLAAAADLAAAALEGPGYPLAAVRLLAPLQPASVRDFAAFEEHVEGVRRSVEGAAGVPGAWYDAPAFYFTSPHAILGPGEPVLFPATSVARDFELEVAVIVGADGASLSVQEAAGHVFGYTIMNDWSARDLQGREMQAGLGPAKGKDFGTSLGPWIVTADELEPCHDPGGFLDLWCSAQVNGNEVGRDLLSNMAWTFPALLACASRDTMIRAGDVLGSGTAGNGGCLAELWGRRGRQSPPPLVPGDVVTLTVERIGSLTATVGQAPAAGPLPPPRRRDTARAREAARAIRADARAGQ